METEYLNLLRRILTHGTKKTDRTGVGTLSVFGHQMRFDLTQGFPLLTTKKVYFKGIAHELLWILRGDTNIRYLQENNVTIWDEWADSEGNLGPVYGKQWRAWQTAEGQTVDQVQTLLQELKTNPNSRRLIISAWNVGELPKMALPPCHLLFQFYVADNQLSCMITQRSGDVFLGVPFNIASYALLTHLVAHQANLKPKELIWSGGDCHIYLNHLEQVSLQLARQPYPFPQLAIKRKPDNIFDYCYEDFELVNYQCHPAIKAEVAV